MTSSQKLCADRPSGSSGLSAAKSGEVEAGQWSMAGQIRSAITSLEPARAARHPPVSANSVSASRCASVSVSRALGAAAG